MAPARPTRAPLARSPETAPAVPAPAQPVAAAPAAELFAATGPAKVAQDEFGFGEIESRGHFEKTDRNLFDGQDLDVPTYLRKGIKISL
jgi:cell division protein FtsZ